jgi:hypothetical protein
MKLVAFVATAVLAAAPSVFAQNVVTAKVPFPFQVESKTLPAGTYDFTISEGSGTVKVQNDASPSAAAEVLIITHLAAQFHPRPNEHAHVVFDKVGNTYTLSELWEPGMDGILVHATKEKHEHYVIHVTK